MGRTVWLVVVPVLCAIAPWFIYGVADLDPTTGTVSDTSILLEAAVPMLGVVSIIAYRLLGDDTRQMWPMLPFAALAVCFCIAHIVVTQIIQDEDGTLEGTSYWYNNLWAVDIYSFFLMPIVAVVGGFIAFKPPAPLS